MAMAKTVMCAMIETMQVMTVALMLMTVLGAARAAGCDHACGGDNVVMQ